MPTKEKNPPYLRKKGTDQVFAFSELLLPRGDMEPWWEPTSEGNAETIDTSANKITAIVNAISKLDPAEDFTKKDKTPKAPSLSRVVGFDVTSDERDEAWKIFMEKAQPSGGQNEESKVIENGK